MCAELPTGHGTLFATSLPSELTLPIDPQTHQTLAHDHLHIPVGNPSMLRSIQPPRSTSGTVSHVRTLTPRTYAALYHQRSARPEPVLKINNSRRPPPSASPEAEFVGPSAAMSPRRPHRNRHGLLLPLPTIPPPNITVAQTPQPLLNR